MHKYIFTPFIVVLILLFAATDYVSAQLEHTGRRAIGTPHNPKVNISWNRYYDLDEILDFCNRMVAAHPDLVRLEVIGTSFKGNDILALTLTDFKTGNYLEKPAFFVQANLHANELQGTEISMYTAWYLAENFGEIEYITELMKEKTFYILPTVNPDGREFFFTQPTNMNTPRTGLIPLDSDGDWEVNEDGFDDLNNDGHITMMRRKNPNGRWLEDPEFPTRMIPAKPGEPGEYEMLGYEGIDRDGDGRVNEDGEGFYDPNRDWAWGWQPDYVQRGSFKYPFSVPENRAVADFVYRHPNIAGAQSYHNFGGMFLRGPGAEEDLASYDRNDIAVYDLIGQTGERIVPGYRYLVAYKDLYTVFGGDLDFFHGSRGVFSFVNELMTTYHLFHSTERTNRNRDSQFHEFDKLLLFGDAYVPWEPYNHPQFGMIEIGGPKKNYIRNTPGFLMEEEAHRNMAFTLFHAYHTPKIEIQDMEKKSLPGGLTELTVTIANTRMIPTHSSHDVRNKINPPNLVAISGAEVVSGILLENKDFGLGREQVFEPATLMVPNIPGMGIVNLRWIVKGNPRNVTIEVNSQKGGVHRRTFDL